MQVAKIAHEALALTGCELATLVTPFLLGGNAQKPDARKTDEDHPPAEIALRE